MQGVIKAFVEERYFGFICGTDGKDYFFHGTQLEFSGDEIRIAIGDPVEFEPVATHRGPEAHNVKLLEI